MKNDPVVRPGGTPEGLISQVRVSSVPPGLREFSLGHIPGDKETVSKLGGNSKSWHDQGRKPFSRPHPNPLPEGEGAHQEPLYGPLSLWERDRVRVQLWHDSRWSMSFETVSKSSSCYRVAPAGQQVHTLGQGYFDAYAHPPCLPDEYKRPAGLH